MVTFRASVRPLARLACTALAGTALVCTALAGPAAADADPVPECPGDAAGRDLDAGVPDLDSVWPESGPGSAWPEGVQDALPEPLPDDGPAGVPAPGCGDDADRAALPQPGWSSPLQGSARVSAAYGTPGDWQAGHHTGIDLAVPDGTAVRSVGPGTVQVAGWWPGSDYGIHVLVHMTDGHYVLYGHLSRLSVRKGQRVRGGQLLGYSGHTGNATGPHLHLEVRKTARYGSDIDPVPYLARHGVWL